MIQFINKSSAIMVATDVPARGIDIKGLAMVINYELPHDEATYTHRIGRTGRAGEAGIAFTLYTNRESYKAENYKNDNRIFNDRSSLVKTENYKLIAKNTTIVIEGGKKNKIRRGDILGALTKEASIEAKYIGKIDIYDKQSYIAVDKNIVTENFTKIKNTKIKGKKFPIWAKNS